MTIDPATIHDKVFAAVADYARKDFYIYCKAVMPRFYTDDKVYLKTMCKTLQDFITNKLFDENGKAIDNLIMNLAPRHGKTLTKDNLCKWSLGHDNLQSIINVCYNETLSTKSARTVRDGIQELRGTRLVHSDIFPDCKIKDGDAAVGMWSLAGSPFSFLATSPHATLTGNGGRLIVIDDLVKDSKEAFNESLLEEKWSWYTDTLLSRMESGAKQLIIMTRWCDNDICGKLLKVEPEKWHVIKMRANKAFPDSPKSDADMLAPGILSADAYMDRKTKTDDMIFSAQYDQEPIDTRDRLYSEFKTYTAIPEGARVYNYTDTADEGADNLCSIDYAVSGKLAYIVNVIYTKEAMETTEGQVASMLTRDQVVTADIESNNGGRGFARAVERIMRDNGNMKTVIKWFTQTQNKVARIVSNATGVSNCIVMPEGWAIMWPRFHKDITSLGRASKWAHDDAPDALTGVYEKGILTKRIVGADFRL